MRTLRRLMLALAVVLLVFFAAGLAACSSSSPGAGTSVEPGAPAESAGATEGQPAAEQQAVPGEEPLHTGAYKPVGDEIAVVTTNRGVIKFKFFPKDAPNTVSSFIELVGKRFYDGTTWHRVEPNFVIQGGDPLSKTLPAGDPRLGTGGPGYRLKPEFNTRKHLLGTVAMARSEAPDSAGSQFYICLAPQPSLDGQYTVFGQVISGLDVVQKTQVGDKVVSIRIEHGPAGR